MKDWMCIYDKMTGSAVQFDNIYFKEFGASAGISDISFQFNSEEDISLYFPVSSKNGFLGSGSIFKAGAAVIA